MSFETNRTPDTETVKQSANFYQETLGLPDDVMNLYTDAMQEKISNIIDSTNNKENILIESMWNIDLLPNENILQEKLNSWLLITQVNQLMNNLS